jgi:hypothetical protein
LAKKDAETILLSHACALQTCGMINMQEYIHLPIPIHAGKRGMYVLTFGFVSLAWVSGDVRYCRMLIGIHLRSLYQ